ncbi:MAG: MFS transporter [Gammaproteobacteria bacterium]|nr:MAG: MFS transporter [Gammaproteobacteria bacterium]
MTGSSRISRWLIVGLLFVALFVLVQAFASLPPLFAEIRAEIPMSKAQMGMVFALVTLASIFLALAAGSAADRFGSRWIIGGALLAAGLGAGMRVLVTSVAGLAISTVLVGVGVACLYPSIPRVLRARFPANAMGVPAGLVFAAAPLGVGAGLATSASLLSPLCGGWRGAMALIGGVCVLVAVIWVLVWREPGADAVRGSHDLRAGLAKVLGIRDVWLLGLYLGAFNFAMGPIMSLLPVLLRERGISHEGELVAIVMWAGVIGTLVTGVLSDRLGRKKAILVGAALLAALCIPSFAAVTGNALVVALVMTGVAQGMALPIVMTLPVDVPGVGPPLAGSAIGLTFTLGNLIGITGPVIAGKVIDVTGAPRVAFLLIAGLLVAAAMVMLLLRENSDGQAAAHAASFRGA